MSTPVSSPWVWLLTGSRLVFVYDPSDAEVIPVGKQTKNPRHIWYRPCSGIWQTVWLESVPEDHIKQLDVAAAMDGTGTQARRDGSRGR